MGRAVTKHDVGELARLRRIADLDGMVINTTDLPERMRAWGGTVAVMDHAGSVLFTAGRLADVRAWLHTRANERTCSGVVA